ncbi:MAG: DoxX family membrane protein [Planctomycetota bacterium]
MRSLPRLALGLVYLHFGLTKWFVGVSPVEALATTAISEFGLGLTERHIVLGLALWETAAGLLLLWGRFRRGAAALVLAHLLGTFTTFVVVPELVLGEATFALTLEGQYVAKNLVLAAVAWSLWSEPTTTAKRGVDAQRPVDREPVEPEPLGAGSSGAGTSDSSGAGTSSSTCF